jgi:hypothetical protein
MEIPSRSLLTTYIVFLAARNSALGSLFLCTIIGRGAERSLFAMSQPPSVAESQWYGLRIQGVLVRSCAAVAQTRFERLAL